MYLRGLCIFKSSSSYTQMSHNKSKKPRPPFEKAGGPIFLRAEVVKFCSRPKAAKWFFVKPQQNFNFVDSWIRDEQQLPFEKARGLSLWEKMSANSVLRPKAAKWFSWNRGIISISWILRFMMKCSLRLKRLEARFSW